ncbi:Hypothetical predicted protein [Pelobates cultripes]|uniref:Uncharacterized protein n=1 Tax=Pelobates cultripes TaxID=61616 RepID=A0AAD1WN54_PELCU|nr:Hypothetical predicted protein [Pelobates cultripes]
MDELGLANNELVDKIQKMEASNRQFQEKLADLEDRSRHNNIRMRGVLETVLSNAIPQYLTEVFKAILPSADATDQLMDREHMVPKPRNLAQDVPRDIVTCLHYYHVREAILMAQQKAISVPEI